MVGDGFGEAIGKSGIVRMKCEEGEHRSKEVFDVFLLGFAPTLGVRFLLLGKAFRGSLGFEFSPYPLDGRYWCPYASGKDLPSLLFCHDPMIASGLHSARA